jgi:hypothetical protein
MMTITSNPPSRKAVPIASGIGAEHWHNVATMNTVTSDLQEKYARGMGWCRGDLVQVV